MARHLVHGSFIPKRGRYPRVINLRRKLGHGRGTRTRSPSVSAPPPRFLRLNSTRTEPLPFPSESPPNPPISGLQFYLFWSIFRCYGPRLSLSSFSLRRSLDLPCNAVNCLFRSESVCSEGDSWVGNGGLEATLISGAESEGGG